MNEEIHAVRPRAVERAQDRPESTVDAGHSRHRIRPDDVRVHSAVEAEHAQGTDFSTGHRVRCRVDDRALENDERRGVDRRTATHILAASGKEQ